ncbi:MAG: hypothetical protein WBW90_25630, partial [Candidatus Acidiferrum sp.]
KRASAKHRAKQKAARRAAHPKRARYHANEKPPTSNLPFFHFTRTGLSIVRNMSGFPYRFRDPRGRTIREDTRSAECLLAHYVLSRFSRKNTGDSLQSTP